MPGRSGRSTALNVPDSVPASKIWKSVSAAGTKPSSSSTAAGYASIEAAAALMRKSASMEPVVTKI